MRMNFLSQWKSDRGITARDMPNQDLAPPPDLILGVHELSRVRECLECVDKHLTGRPGTRVIQSKPWASLLFAFFSLFFFCC